MQFLLKQRQTKNIALCMDNKIILQSNVQYYADVCTYKNFLCTYVHMCKGLILTCTYALESVYIQTFLTALFPISDTTLPQ